MKLLIMCEGPNELKIINILLENQKLKFTSDDLLGLVPYHARQIKSSAAVKAALNLYPDEVHVLRIGDGQNEKLEIPSAYKDKITLVEKYRKKAYVFCERALFQMVVKDLKDIDVSIEWDVSQIIQYAKWKQVVIEILIRLPSADEECGQWVTNSRDIVHKILVSHNVAMRDGITMNDAIKIKTRDKKHPDFRKIPIRCYFEIKSKAEYTYSSIHGVKGETFDALMLLIHGTVGNTLTPSFLANGKTNTELMRIAYVAMTRPRKLLVVAMPKNKAKLSNRFPPDKWDYVEL